MDNYRMICCFDLSLNDYSLCVKKLLIKHMAVP